MTRITCVLAAILLAACSSAPEATVFQAPEKLDAGWTLSATEDVPAGNIPDEIKQRELRYAVLARYTGPGDLSATFYKMSVGGTAFELLQKWRPEPGRLAFYKSVWFVVLESDDLDTAALSAIADEMERLLPAS